MPCESPERQLRNYLADDRRELEAMTRARAHQPDVAMAWVTVDDEVAVGGIGVDARHRGYRRPIEERQAALEEGPDRRLVLSGPPSIDLIRGRDPAAVVSRGLDTMPRVRDTVEVLASPDFPEEDGHPSRVEELCPRRRPEPEEYLPLALKGKSQVRKQ